MNDSVDSVNTESSIKQLESKLLVPIPCSVMKMCLLTYLRRRSQGNLIAEQEAKISEYQMNAEVTASTVS